ncbi:hypothetical protein EOS_03425 [Caballeronia mineralivorans PML1(12)]|uniref:Helix-turn-helix domain-containing protein n=1 Tax=Caballeronia mineralivorans PML1(12) TaxID=908627 RepID=A0A0J1D4N4_9BURK|nr:helix-turn-helix domain-containing protein [Caballeronia mineralivorans]KLU27672.1 hypothetical protein EOS_03425 [Caballeronia mineralivorans PML1(12)]
MTATKLLTPAEAAAFMGFSIRALESWRIRGEGPPFIKLPRAVRYSEEALLAFLEASTRTATKQTAAQAKEATKVRSIRQPA